MQLLETNAVSLLQAIVLGFIQGATEFLPISSSAHLIIVPWLFGWDQPGLSFDAALHLGTLSAVLVYFSRDIVGMVRALPHALRSPLAILRNASPATPADQNAKLALLIAIATIPGLLMGLALESRIEEFYHSDGNNDRSMIMLAAALMALGLLLYIAERRARHVRDLKDTTPLDALVVGIAQASAIIPGVSRSGSTITMGLFRGLRRPDAARFSFLLGTPIIAGAGLKGLVDTLQSGLTGSEMAIFFVGLLVSAITGFAAIWGLLRFLQKQSTVIFVIYRFGMGILIITLVASGIR